MYKLRAAGAIHKKRFTLDSVDASCWLFCLRFGRIAIRVVFGFFCGCAHTPTFRFPTQYTSMNRNHRKIKDHELADRLFVGEHILHVLRRLPTTQHDLSTLQVVRRACCCLHAVLNASTVLQRVLHMPPVPLTDTELNTALVVCLLAPYGCAGCLDDAKPADSAWCQHWRRI